MSKQTPLYQQHRDLGAKLVPFAGWEMPLHYGSQLQEHREVRSGAGLFDVSHMQIVELQGPDAKPFLQRLLANDVGRLQTPGRALYSCMLNEQGGVIDDLIVYFRDSDHYRLVVNAGTASKDLDWLRHQVHGFEVRIEPREDLALVALQGPEAAACFRQAAPESL